MSESPFVDTSPINMEKTADPPVIAEDFTILE
jgi:hypothetical protein